MNAPETLVADGLDGFAAAHADIVVLGPSRKFLRRKVPSRSKVALISGGGGGHEPLHAGFVGLGMLDAACPGQIFTAPTPDQIVEAAEAVVGPPGALLIVKNYAGDRMNFEMASERLKCRHATLLVEDDVTDQSAAPALGRRGVAGALIVEKLVGAAAEAGADLEACLALGAKVQTRTRTIGVGLSYCNLPGGAARTLGPDEMELGVGIHGEPGRRKVKMASADVIAEDLIAAILNDLAVDDAAEALLLINDFGGTPLNELYVVYNSARRSLSRRGVGVARPLVGAYVTSLDMMGCSITVCLLDAELARLWDSPVHTASLRW